MEIKRAKLSMNIHPLGIVLNLSQTSIRMMDDQISDFGAYQFKHKNIYIKEQVMLTHGSEQEKSIFL